MGSVAHDDGRGLVEAAWREKQLVAVEVEEVHCQQRSVWPICGGRGTRPVRYAAVCAELLGRCEVVTGAQ